ncbi:Wzz/FepE/Etk N-terminal domain-containing protein [Bacillus gobiensis]|uniref:YveK family protein n=1 Tax=Bacillus gobiensis TaxID=1441095 RepID=UPI003D1FC3DE
MEETISLKEIFAILKKRMWLIIIITMIATMTSAAVSFFALTPTYEASTQILVNQSKSDEQAFNYNEIQTNLELINTYNVIIKSPAILQKVKQELNLEESVEQLNSQISIESENQSQVVNISVQDPDQAKAANVANTVADVFETEIKNIMNVDNVSILSRSEVNPSAAPVSPRININIAIAFVVGFMVSVGLAFLLDYFDNTIKSEEEIEKTLELPVLGTISMINREMEMNTKKQKKLESNVRGESLGS